MKVNKKIITFFIFFLYFVLLISSVYSQDLIYKKRGNRYEGLKERPLSVPDIELISARINYNEEIIQDPSSFKLKFYLKQNKPDVFITVRELDYIRYYWMDKVEPSWKSGFNEFIWSTDDVIKHLEGLKMYDLGVVIRLGEEHPTIKEKIAPAIFYHSKFPSGEIKEYLFTFKCSRDAKLVYSFCKDGDENNPLEKKEKRVWGDEPFTILWRCPTTIGDGLYNLSVKGHFFTKPFDINYSLQFYHNENLQ